MSRADEFALVSKNPVKKYLQWDSAEKSFKHYNKEAGKNELVKLPITFISLKEMATISGFHEASSSSIYSNEVASHQLKTKELVVKSAKGASIAKGFYSDIKPTIIAAGGKFASSVYALLGGELVCLKLSGSSFSAWYDFANENRKAFLGNTVQVLGALDMKKGATKYSQPIFTMGNVIAEKDNADAEKAYAELVEYMNSRESNPQPQLVEAEEVAPQRTFAEAEPANDVLPF